MKKTTIIIFLIFISHLCGQNLKIYYGNRLYYQNGDKFYKIKELKNGANFQGYDIVDSMHIFFAYENETSAEASTFLSIYDIAGKKEIVLEELGGTGESFFQYNIENDYVLFNWYNGLYTFKVHDNKNQIVKNSEKKCIIKCSECYLPFWVNSNKIGYQAFKDEKWVLKYLKLLNKK